MNPEASQMQEEVCHGLSDKSTRKRTKYASDDEKTEDGGFKIKTYYPTLEQMKDFSSYMKFIHQDGGHRAGLAKIVPPNGYRPRKIGYDDESLYEMEIKCPIRQEVNGEGGLYQQMNIVDKKKMTVRNFKRLSEEKHPTPFHREGSTLDRDFWKNVFTNPSIYGADVPGSLFDPDFEEFNLTKLNTILDDIRNDYGVTIEGVNTTYLYFGMWKSSFCWHTEDMDLYSINYLHTGAPKSWYCIAPEYGRRFERLAESFFPHSFKSCKAFLRHKTTLISPQVLKKYGIPFSRGIQYAGEFMVTFPYSYHSGFNNGFNIAEATNFATEHWIDFGKWATRCDCSTESVKISMQTFVKRYQSERYENWVQGKDVCKDPRDPKHVAAAPRPTEHDLFVMGVHDRYNDESYMEVEQEDDRRRVALQQNLSSNLKRKTKSLKKSFKSIEESCQRYTEYLLAHNNHHNKPKSDQQITLPHYSPLETNMVTVSETVPIRLNCDQTKLDFKSKPDYDKLIKDNKKLSIKSKKDEKINQKKEQRARERIIASQELLQFLPITFTHEKRFNRCIAALPPHCAVCQMLLPHPKDDENIWGTKKTTTEVARTADEQRSTSTSQETSNISDNEIPLALDIKPTQAGTQVEEFKLPKSSKVLLPRAALSDHAWCNEGDESSGGDTAPAEVEKKQETEEAQQELSYREADSGYEDRMKFLDIDIEEPYELLQCTVCMLCVHSICYGIDKIPDNKEDWVCDRCMETNRSIINCVLCPCRGGALKLVDNHWLHISCALTLPNVKLNDLFSVESERKRNIKLPDLPSRTPCSYCVKNANISKYLQGRCLPCIGYGPNRCDATFHPTCGHRNGAQFEILDHHADPAITQTMIVRCAECNSKIQSGYETLDGYDCHDHLEPISVGTRVVALSYKRGSYYDGTIQCNLKRISYELFFPKANEIDVSVSERNVINPDKSKEFAVGDVVRVRTAEGEIEGKFRRKRYNESEYLIRFAGSLAAEKVYRKDIYLNIDQMSEEQVEEYLSSTGRADDIEFTV